MSDETTPSTVVRTGVHVGSWPLGLPTTPRFYSDLAQRAETLGFDLFFAGDHVFTHNPIPESLTVLTWVAASAPSLTVGTGVLLLPLREPLIVAKQLATLDLLSEGRLIAGFGVGGEMDQEWQALEIPRSGRGRRMDEYLDIVRAHWSGEPIEIEGTFRTVRGVVGSPAPHRPGGPPIVLGGRSDAALERASRHDGWCAYAVSPSRLTKSISMIAERRAGDMAGFRTSYVLFTYVDPDARRARGVVESVLGRRYQQDFSRFVDTFCAVGPPSLVAETIARYREAGVEDLLLAPQAPAEEMPEQFERLAEIALSR